MEQELVILLEHLSPPGCSSVLVLNLKFSV